jgi:membrane protein YdbS with pleckstrin-like domain
MQFIKKKNLLEREELLYIPALHWMYVLKPVAIVSLLMMILLILWSNITSYIRIFNNEQLSYLVFLSIVIVSFVLILRYYLFQTIEYGVTNRRFIIKKGAFTIMTTEIPTDRIESIYCLQSIFGRIFNYGTICISGIGGRMPIFYMIQKPYALRRRIVDIIEKNKTIHIIHGELPKPRLVIKPEQIKEDPYMWGTFVCK